MIPRTANMHLRIPDEQLSKMMSYIKTKCIRICKKLKAFDSTSPSKQITYRKQTTKTIKQTSRTKTTGNIYKQTHEQNNSKQHIVFK